MKIKSFLIACLLSFGFALPSAQADIYWAAEPDRLVDDRTLNSRSSYTGPTLRQVLSGSYDRDVQQAYQSPEGQGGLYLLLRDENGVWHQGGEPPATHVTVELWYGDRYQATCHVYPFRDEDDPRFFYTTCNR